MLNTALTIILDEHRSLAAVTHGLRFLVREMREKNIEPDGKLLWAMLYYIDTFPQKLHHPKEEAYLFRRLKMRTREADKAILVLEEQHRSGAEHVKALEMALGRYQAGAPGGREAFMAAAETFADELAVHIELRDRGPVAVILDPLPDIGIGQHIHIGEFDAHEVQHPRDAG